MSRIRSGVDAAQLPRTDGAETTARAEPVRPAADPDSLARATEARSTTTATDGLALPATLPAQPTTYAADLSRFDRALSRALEQAGGTIPARERSRLRELCARLAISHARTPAGAAELAQTLAALARDVSRLGLLRGVHSAELNSALDLLLRATIERMGDDVGATFRPIIGGGHIVGIQVEPTSLTPHQAAGLDAARMLVAEVQHARAWPARPTPAQLQLLAVRNTMQRHILMTLREPPVGEPIPGTPTEPLLFTDVLTTVDRLLPSQEPIGQDVLDTLRRLQAAVEKVDGKRLGDDLNRALGSLHRDVDQARNRFDPQRFAEHARRSGERAAAETQRQAAYLVSNLEGANARLLTLLAANPAGQGTTVGKWLKDLEPQIAALQAGMPPLPPFTYTLSSPLNVAAGGTTLTLPAGSQLSRNATGNFVALTPSLVMNSGGTSIVSGPAQINLGADLSRLHFDQVLTTAPGTTVDLRGADLTTDHQLHTTVLRADTATIELAAGTFNLTNAQLLSGPNGTHLEAATLLMETSNAQFSMEGLTGDHAEHNGNAVLDFAASNANGNWQNLGLTAQRLSGTFVQGADGDQSIVLQAENFTLNTPAVNWQGTSGQLSLLQTDQGSELRARGTDLAFQSGTGSVTTQGASSLLVQYDAAGQVKTATARAEKVAWTGNGTAITANGEDVRMALSFNEQGKLTGLTSQASDLTITGTHGDSGHVKDGDLSVSFNDQGKLAAISAQAEQSSVDWGGTKISADNAAFAATYDDHGKLQRLVGRSGPINASGSFGTIATNGAAEVRMSYGDTGKLARFTASVGQVTYQAARGDTLRVTDGAVDLRYDERGQLGALQAQAQQLTHTANGNTLQLTEGQLSATYANGLLQRIDGKVGSGSYSGTFGSVTLPHGGNVKATYQYGLLAAVEGDVRTVNYADPKYGDLKVSGGTFTGRADAAGNLNDLWVRADKVDFTGTGAKGQLNKLQFDGVAVHVGRAADGSQSLVFTGTNGKLGIDNYVVGVDQVEKIRVDTNATGEITAINATFPGLVTFRETGADGDRFKVSIVGLNGDYARQTGEVNIDFTKADVQMVTEGLSATFRDAQIKIEERQARIRIAEGSFLRELEGKMKMAGSIQGVELLLRQGATGKLAAANLSFEQLKLVSEKLNVYVKNAQGQVYRIETRFTADGKSIQSVFAQIPDGGEVVVATEDMKAVFGPLQATLSRQPDGGWRLRAEDVKSVDATWKGLVVHVDGQLIDAGIDGAGRLVFNDVRATHISAKGSFGKINIDVTKLNNLMVGGFGVSATGARLEIVPASPGRSSMSLAVHTTRNGIPMSLIFDDVGALTADAAWTTNAAQVRLSDPTGQGSIAFDVGPLRLEGKSIGARVDYRPFDSEVMLDDVGRFLHREGNELALGLGLNMDSPTEPRLDAGVYTAHRSGLYGEFSVLLPRREHYQLRSSSYLLKVGELYDPRDPSLALESDDGSTPGLVLSLRGAGVTKDRVRYVGEVGVGLVPASYLDLHLEGDLTAFGFIPMSEQFKLPSTAAAYAKFGRYTQYSALELLGGYFDNLPVTRINGRAGAFVADPVARGGFFAVEMTQPVEPVTDRAAPDTISVGVHGLIPVNEKNQPLVPGLRVQLGYHFKSLFGIF